MPGRKSFLQSLKCGRNQLVDQQTQPRGMVLSLVLT